MKAKLSVSVLFIFMLGSAFLGSIQQSAEQLYQAGVYKEDVEGKLEEAIAIYQEIVKAYPQNSLLAAKALFHMGLCYEKLGNQEAQKAYQRLIADYPGQKEEVALAKERLAELMKIAASVSRKPTFRKIRTPFSIPFWSGALLSSDGKTLAFGSGNVIWTVPIPGNVDPDLAGEPKELPGASDVLGDGLSWSGDGKWIAFSRAFTRNLREGATRIDFRPEGAQIDVVPLSGGELKRIPVPQWVATKGDTQRRLSLSPDGKTVAFDSGGQIYAASVDTGEIKQVTKNGGVNPCFSPDGRKIAYLTPPVRLDKPPFRVCDVMVISADGENPVKVSGDMNEHYTGPIWSPDGKMIAFRRDVGGLPGRQEICIVPVSEDGKPLGSPVQIELPQSSTGFLSGWTPDNKVGLLFVTPYLEYVYTVPVSGGKATQVSLLKGLANHPRWSPDGKRIFFRWEDGGIGSVSSDGGELRIHPGLGGGRKTGFFIIYPGAGNSVSPDGKSTVFSAGTAKVGPNIYTIPVEGGEPKQITLTSGGRYPCWSPDGKWIAYLDREDLGNEKFVATIFKIPVDGGEAQKITSNSASVTIAPIDWSPDGKTIAYFSKKADTVAGTLNLIPAAGGESREVCTVQNIRAHDDLSWSPDGQKIAFTSSGKIWVVPAKGGNPEEVKTDVDAHAGTLDWSPDGRKIAFSGESGMDIEFWFMENFLHLLKK